MKKLLSIALALTLALTALSGCSQPESGQPGPETTPPASTPGESQGADAKETAPNAANLNAGDFDSYPRPRIVTDHQFTVGYLYEKFDSESQQRSMHQNEIEAAHRGWKLVNAFYNDDAGRREAFLNLINQDVDAIMLGGMATTVSVQDLIDQARGAGIGVYSNDNAIVDGIISNCTMPNGIASLELMYTIGADHGWTDKICISTVAAQQIHLERSMPAEALAKATGTMEVFSVEDIWTRTTVVGPAQATNEVAKAWLQKYGDSLTGIFTTADICGMAAAEAVKQGGDATGEKVWVSGIDGGSQAWTYIRDNTPFQYTYSQPFELFTHNVFEIIDQLQVQGLNPGDAGCLISRPGETVYSSGLVTTRNNVPAVGESIHSVFDFYGMDKNDPNAWFNWTEAGGAFLVEDGANS